MADAVVRHGTRCCGRGVAADVISDVSRTAEERALASRAGVGWRKAAMHCESATRAPPGRAFRVAGRRDRRGGYPDVQPERVDRTRGVPRLRPG